MGYRNYAPANGFHVNANGTADFTSVNSAIAAATAGQTIYLHGTVTENVTLKVGVDVVSWPGEGQTSNATIIGTCTLTTAGTVTISGIRLQTNSAALLAVTGSAASIINLDDCYLNCSNNTGITLSSSSASSKITINNCFGDLGTTGIALFAHSGAGSLIFSSCIFFNSGSSTTASTVSGSGNVQGYYAIFSNPITTSSTSTLTFIFCVAANLPLNTTMLTIGGSGSNLFTGGYVSSGTASAISIGSNLYLANGVISSSNTNAITGAGTLTYSGLSFSSSVKINTTTQVGGTLQGGVVQAPSAGFIGEQIRATVAQASAVTLSTNTGANVTSISVTAGVWDISGVVLFSAAAITGTFFSMSVNTTSATLGTNGDNSIDNPTAPTGVCDSCLTLPAWRLTVTSTTTVYLVAFATFTVGTLKAYGRISATRVA